jgi:hypothetical protein
MFRALPDNNGGINDVKTTGWRGKAGTETAMHDPSARNVVCVGMLLSGGHVVEAQNKN